MFDIKSIRTSQWVPLEAARDDDASEWEKKEDSGNHLWGLNKAEGRKRNILVHTHGYSGIACQSHVDISPTQNVILLVMETTRLTHPQWSSQCSADPVKEERKGAGVEARIHKISRWYLSSMRLHASVFSLSSRFFFFFPSLKKYIVYHERIVDGRRSHHPISRDSLGEHGTPATLSYLLLRRRARTCLLFSI